MPVIGLSGMTIAKYNYTSSNVTYTDGRKFGRARSFSTNIDSSDGSNYYADNGVAESQNSSFTSGTIDITTAESDISIAEYIHGLTITKTQIGDEEFEEVVYDDDSDAPYVGWGCVRKKQIRGKIVWDGLVFPKLGFQLGDEAADTEEETVDWQDHTDTATIMKDDTTKHRWKRHSVDFNTEAEAQAYVNAALGITDTPPEV